VIDIMPHASVGQIVGGILQHNHVLRAAGEFLGETTRYRAGSGSLRGQRTARLTMKVQTRTSQPTRSSAFNVALMI